MTNTQCAAEMSNMTPDQMNTMNPLLTIGYSISPNGTMGMGISAGKAADVKNHLNGSNEDDRTEIIEEVENVIFGISGGRPC